MSNTYTYRTGPTMYTYYCGQLNATIIVSVVPLSIVVDVIPRKKTYDRRAIQRIVGRICESTEALVNAFLESGVIDQLLEQQADYSMHEFGIDMRWKPSSEPYVPVLNSY